MESVQASVSDMISTSGTGSNDEEVGKSGISDIQESSDLGEDICHDLDSYLEDINDRLTISRMVSNSIIKGMVNAVSQEAADIVAVKELEVATMKEQVLRLQQRGNSEVNASDTLTKHVDGRSHGHRAESLSLPRRTVNQQLERLGQCIGNAKLFSGNAEESILIKNDLDEAFNCLKSLLFDTSQQVDTTTFSLESSVEDWKVELYICKELETMVFCTILQGLQAEYVKQLWNMSNVLAFTDRFDEIANLRHELHSIQKLFDCPEVGNLSPQGSMEMDQLHRKVFVNHSHIWNGSSTCEESKYIIPENFETSPLKHMKAAELYQHFKTLFTNLKRVHESAVQQMTEEYFSLKRDYLKEREPFKERGAFATFRKDKDFETVKTRITEAIVKLDEIVKDNEKLSEFCNYSRDMLNSLLSENFRLKDLLNRHHLETFHLSSQASDATKKLLQHSWAEENLNKLVRDLKCTLRDGHIEAFITEEIYKCIIREMGKLMNSSSEDLNLISVIMQDIYGALYGEIYHAGVVKKSDNEDSDLRSTIEQQIYCTVFQQVLVDLSMNINGWMENCQKKDELLGFLQCKVSEIEIELGEKGKENEELKLQVLLLKDIIKEKNKVSVDITTFYEKERTQFTEELNKLRDQEAHKSNELVLLKHKLEDFEKQIEKLNTELKLSHDKLRKSDEEKTNFTSILNQNYLASMREKDNEHIKHMESLSHVILGMLNSFADFELQIEKRIGWQSVRLDNSTSQLHSFIPKINVLRRTSSLYKERLEKRCSDLQKAEAEVDLLGDEVDALLSLLEKIYVALDHYSPILQHYPGVIEILKLVKRELSRDSVKCHLTAT